MGNKIVSIVKLLVMLGLCGILSQYIMISKRVMAEDNRNRVSYMEEQEFTGAEVIGMVREVNKVLNTIDEIDAGNPVGVGAVKEVDYQLYIDGVKLYIGNMNSKINKTKKYKISIDNENKRCNVSLVG